MQFVGSKAAIRQRKSEILRQLMRQQERLKSTVVENEAEIDGAQVGVLIRCVCGPLRELSQLANKEEVDENKAEVA